METQLPSRYSRHYYDVYKLGKSEYKQLAIDDKKLLNEVIYFKEKFYKCGWALLEDIKKGNLKLIPPIERFKELKKDYDNMKTMLYGDVPTFEELMDYLKILEDEINQKVIVKE